MFLKRIYKQVYYIFTKILNADFPVNRFYCCIVNSFSVSNDNQSYIECFYFVFEIRIQINE